VAAFGRPVPSVCDHRVERDQHRQRGELAGALLELKRRQGFHLIHPHGSSYEPQHLNLEEVPGNRTLISKAVRGAATDGVEGGNDS
jgi:hypothetical protein